MHARIVRFGATCCNLVPTSRCQNYREHSLTLAACLCYKNVLGICATIARGRSFVRPVTLTLISDDTALIALCKESLRSFGPASSWELRIEKSYDVIPSAGICLVDYEPDHNLACASHLNSESTRYFFLVRPTEVEQFRKAVPPARVSILLKPITRAVLDAYLGTLVCSPEIESLRAERDELLHNLLEANVRLQEYDHQRTNYLARAVHEFRVPLTAISGFVDLLASCELGNLNNNQVDALRRMRYGVGILTRLTSTMLELSIAGQREREPQLREGRIEECIDQVLKIMEPIAQEKDLRIVLKTLQLPTTPLLFERGQIEQVLMNLLENAYKASPKRGAVEISGYPYFWERRFLAAGNKPSERRLQSIEAPNSYRIDIRDAGPGIRPEHLKLIFEEYASFSATREPSGGGLGLAICRSIVQRHQGLIWANSQQSGSMFSFVLPFAPGRRSQSTGHLEQKATA